MALIHKEPYDYYERVDIDTTAHLTIKSGAVHLRLYGADVTNGNFSFTIPAAYRPREGIHFVVAQNVPSGGSTSFYLGSCSLGTDGVLTMYVYNNGTATKMTGTVYGTTTWIL